MSEACIPLYQADFANGTFLATTDHVCYELQEDIEFDPAPWADYRASAVEPYASIPAFAADFFAAFAVSARGVTLDLNNYEIRQSVAHRLQQRFFAIIEVADRPFIRGQGPADFSDTMPGAVIGAKEFKLLNGRLGRSSHHGVHGNNPTEMLIADVDMNTYEVAAISINGARDVVVHNVRALGTDTHIPVLATYSSARFLIPFVNRLLDTAAGLVNPPTNVVAAANRLMTDTTHLRDLMANVVEDVVTHGLSTVDAATHPEAARLFGNPTGKIDGNPYGFLFHVHGVAVNGFECDADDARHDLSDHILVEDCEIRNTVGHVTEVIAAMDLATSTPARGPVGDILRMGDIVDPITGAYNGTALSDVKIAFAELLRALNIPKGDKAAGTAFVSDDIIAWARGDIARLANRIASGDILLKRGGDAMFHANKGGTGFRSSGGRHVCLERTHIVGVENTGENGKPVPFPGETEESAYYIGAEDGGHPAQAPQLGYMGADAYGIIIDTAASVLLRSTTVRNIHSRYMWARGIAIFNDARRTHMHDMTLVNITAFTDPAVQGSMYPPKTPEAVGIYTATSAQEPSQSGYIEISDVRAGGIGSAYDSLHANTGISACAAPEANWYGA